MSVKTIQVRQSAAIFSLAIVFLGGGFLGLFAPAWTGRQAFGNSKLVPMFVARAQGGGEDPSAAVGFAPIVKPVLPAVVNISSSKMVHPSNLPSTPFFNDPFFRQFFGGGRFFHQFQMPRAEREQSLGSGVIVSADGYILTNNHVIDDATEIRVFLPDKREFKGKVIGRDKKTDIAVVKIDATGLPTVTLGDSSKLNVGDYALAIGDPFGVGETATMGIVSATGRNGLDIEDYEDFIQTDAAINPGNSGGALINAQGDLIGINTAILTGGGGGNQGIGFAIPINLARNVMEQILKNGKVIRGWLGVVIQEVTPNIAKAFKVPQTDGALISDVDPKGPAAGAGLARGDVIVELDGKPISRINDLRLQIAQMAPGTTIHLKVLRNGEPREFTVKLGELPEKEGQGISGEQGGVGPMQGVQVEGLTTDLAKQLGLPATTRGVMVDDVQPGSPADEAGLRHGDVIEEVNRQPVTNMTEYQRAVQQLGKQAAVLLVNRGGTTTFVVIQP